MSGKSLLQFEKENLLDPLGMTNTGFYVTDPGKHKLIAQPMPNDSDFRVGFDGLRRRSEKVGIRRRRHGLDHGGLCAVLAQMLLNGGRFDGRQYLSPKAFELMTSDHIGPGSGVGARLLLFPR